MKFPYHSSIEDTGADNNMCQMGFAKLLNIDFKGVKPSRIHGIDGQAIRCYFVPISINLGGRVFDSVMGFGESIRAIVLGGQGFLDKWKATFEYAKEIELIMI